MDNLDYHLAFKSVAEDGSIEGIAAGYGNVDLGGDRIMPGAATKALQVRQTLPMLFAHDLAKPIGVWSDLKETPGRAERQRPDRDRHASGGRGSCAGEGRRADRHLDRLQGREAQHGRQRP